MSIQNSKKLNANNLDKEFLLTDLDDSNAFYVDKSKVTALYRERINPDMSDMDKLVKFNTALTLYLGQHDSDFIRSVTHVMEAIRTHQLNKTELSKEEKHLNNEIWAYTKLASKHFDEQIPNFETFQKRLKKLKISIN